MEKFRSQKHRFQRRLQYKENLTSLDLAWGSSNHDVDGFTQSFRAYLCSAWITCSTRNLFPCRCGKAVLTPKPCSLRNNFFVGSRKISSNCSCFHVEKCFTNLLKFCACGTSAFSVASLNAHCYTYMLLISTTRNASSLDNWNYGITVALH